MAELLRADWTRREDLARLVDVLGRDNLRWVGGAVRDTLLGNAVKDIVAMRGVGHCSSGGGDSGARKLTNAERGEQV